MSVQHNVHRGRCKAHVCIFKVLRGRNTLFEWCLCIGCHLCFIWVGNVIGEGKFALCTRKVAGYHADLCYCVCVSCHRGHNDVKNTPNKNDLNTT